MSEQSGRRTTPPEMPAAVVRTKNKSFSIVWVVPVVALLIGGWLAYKALTEKGPTITITFNTAEGLEAGKTKIKYKDVEVGKVDSITFSKDLSHVVVTAELVKESEDYLTENTRFWVVRARVAAGEVSGLGTLFSGAYIGMDPRKGEEETSEFTGLEIPPVITDDLPGRHFVLRAESLGSLEVGSPVYYRQIKAGQVVAYKLDEDGRAVSIRVFIHAPHHKIVHRNTRFWNAGGLDVSVDASGIKVDTESFVSMMIGGLAFDTPENLEPGGAAEEGDVFLLYKNRRSIYEKTYTDKRQFILYFDGSVRGLSRGAPVDFRGIKIGEVTDIKLEYHDKELELRIPVLIEIEPERIVFVGQETRTRKERMEQLVERGLRAQLKTGSLLTGQLLIDLDFHPEAPPRHVVYEGKYPELPTVPTPLEEITTRVVKIVEKLENLPIEQIGNDLRDTVQGAKRLVNSPELREAIHALKEALEQAQQLAANLNTEVASKINATLEQAQQTLAAAEKTVSPDSTLQYELERTLRALGEAARALSAMADYLERHPDSVIFGKGQQQ